MCLIFSCACSRSCVCWYVLRSLFNTLVFYKNELVGHELRPYFPKRIIFSLFSLVFVFFLLSLFGIVKDHAKREAFYILDERSDTLFTNLEKSIEKMVVNFSPYQERIYEYSSDLKPSSEEILKIMQSYLTNYELPLALTVEVVSQKRPSTFYRLMEFREGVFVDLSEVSATSLSEQEGGQALHQQMPVLTPLYFSPFVKRDVIALFFPLFLSSHKTNDEKNDETDDEAEKKIWGLAQVEFTRDGMRKIFEDAISFSEESYVYALIDPNYKIVLSNGINEEDFRGADVLRTPMSSYMERNAEESPLFFSEESGYLIRKRFFFNQDELPWTLFLFTPNKSFLGQSVLQLRFKIFLALLLFFLFSLWLISTFFKNSSHRERQFIGIFNNFFSFTRDGILLLDSKGLIKRVNPAAESMLGHVKKDLVGKNLSTLNGEGTSDEFYEGIWHVAKREGRSRGEVEIRKADGTFSPIELTLLRLLKRKKSDDFIAMLHDLDQRGRGKRASLHEFDRLTEIPNRLYWEKAVEKAIEKSKETGSLLGLLFFNINDFKRVNQRFGHQKGDEVLCEVARKLQFSFRETDVVARFENDQFVIFLDELAYEDDILVVLDRMFENISSEIEVEGEKLALSVSVGVALYPKNANSVSEFLENGRSAMYRAKISEKNYVFFE